jgi:hypothetical protein
MAQEAKARQSALLSILKSPCESPKATLDTMIKIQEALGHFPDKITRSEDEGGGLDYDVLAKMYTILAQQEDPSITEKQVRASLNMGNLSKALEAVNEMLTIDVPIELLSEIEDSKEETEDAGPDDTDGKN